MTQPTNPAYRIEKSARRFCARHGIQLKTYQSYQFTVEEHIDAANFLDMPKYAANLAMLWRRCLDRANS